MPRPLTITSKEVSKHSSVLCYASCHHSLTHALRESLSDYLRPQVLTFLPTSLRALTFPGTSSPSAYPPCNHECIVLFVSLSTITHTNNVTVSALTIKVTVLLTGFCSLPYPLLPLIVVITLSVISLCAAYSLIHSKYLRLSLYLASHLSTIILRVRTDDSLLLTC